MIPMSPSPETQQSLEEPMDEPQQELDAFEIDPRFEVSLASEEEFPDIACSIQMRWITRQNVGQLSHDDPHVYPYQSPMIKS